MTIALTRRSLLALTGATVVAASQWRRAAFAAEGGELVIMQSEAPRSMDAADHTATFTAAVLEPMYESLTAYSPELQLIPCLATSWQGSDDGTIWDMEIRTGVAFHDGTPLDAAAVVASFERHLDPDRGLAASGRLRNVIASIEATGDSAVRFTLKAPYPAFLRLLAGNAAAIVSPAAEAAGTLGSQPVGTGPYKFVEWRTGEYVLSEKNPGYWGEPGGAETLKWTWSQEAAVMNMSILAGEADVVSPMPPVFATSAGASSDVTVSNSEGSRVFWVSLNCLLAPLDDVRVRQALNYATNGEGLVSNLLYGFGTPATSPLAPTTFGFDPSITGYPYDIDKAKELLAEAGHADGISISVAVQEPEANIAEILQGMWAEAGISLEIRRMEGGVWSEAAFAPPEGKEEIGLHSVIASWSTSTFDADLQLRPLYDTGSWSPGSANLGFFSSEELDALLAEAGSIIDADRRAELYARAQRIIVDEAAHVLLYYPQDIVGIRAGVEGVWVIPGGLVVPEHATKA